MSDTISVDGAGGDWLNGLMLLILFSVQLKVLLHFSPNQFLSAHLINRTVKEFSVVLKTTAVTSAHSANHRPAPSTEILSLAEKLLTTVFLLLGWTAFG